MKALISGILRKSGLLHPGDLLRYRYQQFSNRSKNLSFVKTHPDFKLPPDYLMYESFRLDYGRYFTSGRAMASWIYNMVKSHLSPGMKRMLDWGCGPGRIIRHMPQIASADFEFHACDYNSSSIAWCSENLPEIDFRTNELAPPLPYDERYFDLVYGLSIFTHLSEEMHHAWASELQRVLKPGGLLLLSTQGRNHRAILTPYEADLFDRGQPVFRGGVKEGHRVYSAFQPPAFMKQLFANMEIVDFIETEPEAGKPIPQDIWIFRKLADQR